MVAEGGRGQGHPGEEGHQQELQAGGHHIQGRGRGAARDARGRGRQGKYKTNGQAIELNLNEYRDRKITKALEKPGPRRYTDQGGPTQDRHYSLVVIDNHTRHTREEEVKGTRAEDYNQTVPRCSAGAADPGGTAATTVRCTRSLASRTVSTTC